MSVCHINEDYLLTYFCPQISGEREGKERGRRGKGEGGRERGRREGKSWGEWRRRRKWERREGREEKG